MGISEKELLQLNEYYRNQFLQSSRSDKAGDNTMTFIVKQDTDLMLFARAAKMVWESVGDYPLSFRGLIKKQTGNTFATFLYLGALETAQHKH